MTTIKTPLPEKQYNVVHDFTGVASSSSLNVEKTLDVIIDCVAELREVVEGKQNEPDDFHGEGLASLIKESKTPNLRSVKDVVHEMVDVTPRGIREALTTDRAHVASVLIAGLDSLWRHSVVTVKIEPDGTIVKSYTIARSDVEALIRATLTDVTSEEK